MTRAEGPAARQWRDAAQELRKIAADWDDKADVMAPGVCGVVSMSGPNGEPLACGYWPDHEGPHSWSSLPTYVRRPSSGGCVVEEL